MQEAKKNPLQEELNWAPREKMNSTTSFLSSLWIASSYVQDSAFSRSDVMVMTSLSDADKS